MSHIHIPDGILPVWLWVLGYIIVGIYLVFVSIYIKKHNLNKKLIMVGMCSAFMMIAMSIEIVPISYHVNLSALTGILLGPILSPLAVIVTSFFLALMGHGGITVVGLNAVSVSIEAVFASCIFRLIKNKFNKSYMTSAFIATFLALIISTSVSIGITYVGTGNLGQHHHEETVTSNLIRFEGIEKQEEHGEKEPPAPDFNVRKFALLVGVFGVLGWTIESSLTSFIVKYISKVKLDILEP